MILLISNKWDLTVDFVVLELQRRSYPYYRLNAEDLAFKDASIRISPLRVKIGDQKGGCDLHDIGVIWNRRPGHPYDDMPRSERPSPAVQEFVKDQWYNWRSALELLPGVAWINDPSSEALMENKVRQLVKASEVGFDIPKTIVSNDPGTINSFSEKLGGNVIAKALSAPLIEEDDADSFIFTNSIGVIEKEDYDSIRACPIIVQEKIVPKVDIRVNVVGESVIAAKISYQDQAEIDWRTVKEGDVQIVPYDLPSQLAGNCIRYVRENGLMYGAIDLLLRDGKYIFLEINPNGEWGWLQKPHGLPIAEKMVDLMISLDRKSRK